MYGLGMSMTLGGDLQVVKNAVIFGWCNNNQKSSGGGYSVFICQPAEGSNEHDTQRRDNDVGVQSQEQVRLETWRTPFGDEKRVTSSGHMSATRPYTARFEPQRSSLLTTTVHSGRDLFFRVLPRGAYENADECASYAAEGDVG